MSRLNWQFRLRTSIVLIAVLAVLLSVAVAITRDKQLWPYYCSQAASYARHEQEALSGVRQWDGAAATSLEQAALCDQLADDARQGKKGAEGLSPRKMTEEAARYRSEARRFKREAAAYREKAEAHARLKRYFEWRCWLWRPEQKPVP